MTDTKKDPESGEILRVVPEPIAGAADTGYAWENKTGSIHIPLSGAEVAAYLAPDALDKSLRQ